MGELKSHSHHREELIPGITHDNPRNLRDREPSWIKKTEEVIAKWAGIPQKPPKRKRKRA